MRRTLAWLAGALGAAGAARALRRRQQPLPEAGPDPRADELRRRLAEAQPLAAEPDEADALETPVDEAPDPPPTAATREDVHARARAAIEEMRASGADERGDAGGEPAGDA